MKSIDVSRLGEEDVNRLRALRERGLEAKQAIRYMALHILSFADSMSIFREVNELEKDRELSLESYVVILDKWRRQLWRTVEGFPIAKSELEKELDADGIIVPERTKKGETA